MTGRERACGVLALGLLCACGTPMIRVRVAELRVESGRIEETSSTAFSLRHPCIRATAGTRGSPEAQMAFVYRGPSREVEPLASGEVRRQIGLKMRAKNSCNALYIMWHLAPTNGIFVSVKSNPGQSEHAQCGDRGYLNLVARGRRALPPVEEGERHTLRARLEGEWLRVDADGVASWEAHLPPEAFAFDGPAGIRSDNGFFEAEMWLAR